ncbi:metallophosphoesterase family protein [Hyalangium rubrum]|uniref:Metallophosphoesterase n=1 Tax=Hyalangium rubrum TaxID=3103134 RepID=A0ABU5HJ85_9BACT|nr:metallophosphoesterase [Hyalangium sp. s54d21]MDY7233229.1 metallophosphoesterase [Hyalangium sp. s54d21]
MVPIKLLAQHLEMAARNVIAREESSANRQVLDLLDKARQQLVSTSATSSVLEKVPPEASELQKVLHLLSDAHSGNGAPPGEWVDGTWVDDSGNIWGFKKYENLDPGWIESLVDYYLYVDNKRPFPGQGEAPPRIPIPDTARIALVGDWGTGINPALQIGLDIQAEGPDITIHLGDVYYAGTPTEEMERFTSHWPTGKLGSFMLNSNHEMYSGLRGYMQALGDAKFAQQQGFSQFALENSHWMLIGLDSAYYAGGHFYSDGNLNPQTQLPWLTSMAQEAQRNDKQLILLTHHHGLDLSNAPQLLWGQITGALNGMAALWYWGHIHAAVAHPEQQGIQGRCVGHGAIPAAPPPILMRNRSSVVWFEDQSAHDPQSPQRTLNGYMRLTLDGAMVTEEFVAENKQVRWKNQLGQSARPALRNIG